MNFCKWNGCQREARKDESLCTMHTKRKRCGRDMDAPARYQVPRRGMRNPQATQYEALRPRLYELLREGAKSRDMLASALGISRATVLVWLERLEEEDDAYVEQFLLPNMRGGKRISRPIAYYFIFTGKYPDNYPADEECSEAA